MTVTIYTAGDLIPVPFADGMPRVEKAARPTTLEYSPTCPMCGKWAFRRHDGMFQCSWNGCRARWD